MTAGSALLISSDHASSEPVVPQVNQIISPQIDPKIRPRLFVSPDRRNEVEQAIEQGNRELAKSLAQLKARAAEALSRAPTPYSGTQSQEFYVAALGSGKHKPRDGQGARDLALAWFFTGDVRYRDRAIAILKSWATANTGRSLQSKLKNGDINPAIGMHSARAIVPFCYAYDILAPELAPSEYHAIDQWLRDFEIPIETGIEIWKRNRYFDRQLFQNHVVAHTMGLAVIAYATGQRRLAQYALMDESNPRDFDKLVSGVILRRGDTPCPRELKLGRFPVHEGEIYDRYRHLTAPNKGLQYCHLSLSLLTIIAESAFQSGLDLYRYVARSGECLAMPFRFYAEFYHSMDSSIMGGFYDGETDRMTRAGDSTGIFELAAARLNGLDPVEKLLENLDRTSIDHVTELLGPTFLTHSPIQDV